MHHRCLLLRSYEQSLNSPSWILYRADRQQRIFGGAHDADGSGLAILGDQILQQLDLCRRERTALPAAWAVFMLNLDYEPLAAESAQQIEWIADLVNPRPC